MGEGCLEGVSKVSGGYLSDVRMVCEVSFDNIKQVCSARVMRM